VRPGEIWQGRRGRLGEKGSRISSGSLFYWSSYHKRLSLRTTPHHHQGIRRRDRVSRYRLPGIPCQPAPEHAGWRRDRAAAELPVQHESADAGFHGKKRSAGFVVSIDRFAGEEASPYGSLLRRRNAHRNPGFDEELQGEGARRPPPIIRPLAARAG
jgi:hypothetical protein